MWKMIVLDLDGTVLNFKRKISKETKAFLSKLKEQGYIIVIATGRILGLALDVTDGADFASYLLTDTGSMIYKREGFERILANTIDKETARDILNNYTEDYSYIDICSPECIYSYSKIRHHNKKIITTKDINYIMDNCQEISHITVSLKDYSQIEKLYEKFSKKYPDLKIIIMQDSFKDERYIEIFRKDCSKTNAIRYLAKCLKVKEEDIVCFGDGLNDVEMLRNCNFGVAMQNALPEVKEVAKDVTKEDCNNNGVIKYLMEHGYNDEDFR